MAKVPNGRASQWAVGFIFTVVLIAGGWGVSYAIGRTDTLGEGQTKCAERIVAVETTQASQAATLERIEDTVDGLDVSIDELKGEMGELKGQNVEILRRLSN